MDKTTKKAAERYLEIISGRTPQIEVRTERKKIITDANGDKVSIKTEVRKKCAPDEKALRELLVNLGYLSPDVKNTEKSEKYKNEAGGVVELPAIREVNGNESAVDPAKKTDCVS